MTKQFEPTTVSIWSVYERPDDFPHSFIARRFELYAGDVDATNDVIASHDLGLLRRRLTKVGLHSIPRFEDDDPKIIESWI
jgi:hypothetical protein